MSIFFLLSKCIDNLWVTLNFRKMFDFLSGLILMREEMYSEIVVKGAQPENDPETSCGLFSGHVIFCIFCRDLGQMFESWFGWLYPVSVLCF